MFFVAFWSAVLLLYAPNSCSWAAVIVVFVRYENRRKIRRIDAEPRKAPHRFSELESAVDEHAGDAALDKETVALTAAAQ